MSKFFVDKSQIHDNKVVLTGSDVNHITRVLRLDIGDCITVCDGEGSDYSVQISVLLKDTVEGDILSVIPCENEPEVRVTLFQGLPKQGKMEWIIEKCTEIGITTIVPVAMTRSVVKLTEEQAKKKLDRWNKTAVEAAKQCGRGVIPKVLMPVTIEELQKDSLPEFLLLPYEGEKTQPIKETLRGKKVPSAGIFIGPEGGFTEKEVLLLQSLGAHTVTLGPRILRTETAGLSALSVLLYEWDEMQC